MEHLNEFAQWVALVAIGVILFIMELRLSHAITTTWEFVQTFLAEEENQR